MLSRKNKKVNRFSIFFIKNRRTFIKNKFYSKAHCFKVNFSENKFINVNFKGAMLTNCNFKKAKFINVEFFGTNLKKSNFKNAIFERCIFSGALLSNANFNDATFKNCIFLNTSLKDAKKIDIKEVANFYLKHQNLSIDEELKMAVNNYKLDEKIKNTRILHQRGGGINTVTITILLMRYKVEVLTELLNRMVGNLPRRVITIADFENMLDFELHRE